MGDGYFPILGHKKPPFDLPVVYEDDYFAIGKLYYLRLLDEESSSHLIAYLF